MSKCYAVVEVRTGCVGEDFEETIAVLTNRKLAYKWRSQLQAQIKELDNAGWFPMNRWIRIDVKSAPFEGIKPLQELSDYYANELAMQSEHV